MRRWLLLVLLAAAPKDIPPDHWAYQSILRLIQKGWMTLYEDGTFRPGDPVDRLTLARALAHILESLEAGIPGDLTPEDLRTLKRLTEEFKEEVLQYADRIEKLEFQVQKLSALQESTQKDLTRLVDELNSRLESLDRKMREDKKNLLLEIEALNRKVSRLETELRRERARVKRAHTQLWLGILVALAVGAVVG